MAVPVIPWLQLAAASLPDNEFIATSLERFSESFDLSGLFWASGRRGRWQVVASPDCQPPDEAAYSEALDSGTARSGPWLLLALREHPNELLGLQTDDLDDRLDEAVRIWSLVLGNARQFRSLTRRTNRLTAIMDIANHWQQARDMDTLLLRMAEASTELLASERASIFLWDRDQKLLVGRPALGVEGGELRIPDDRGIVGQVVQTGEPARVDADVTSEEAAIDRTVDEQLQFTTRTLLCVPLRTSDDTLIGAFEMINKREGNFTDSDEAALRELAAHAALALENTQQYETLLKANESITNEAAAHVQLIGECPQLDALRTAVGRVADTDLSILILGENGTGKEVVSQMAHYLSQRRNAPFVAVNCAALTETLLESELFGHEKGAFTDAHDTRTGKFELASGGTLFLDEIGDMSLSGQAKLLRVLEEKVVVRVGGSMPIPTDARVIAATNQDLADMVRTKRFREDLYFRLNVVTLELPPLRDRGDDILLLAEHFLHGFCKHAGRKPPKFSAAAKRRLQSHRWPGNVRELRNMMERLAYLSSGDKVDAGDLAFILHPNNNERPSLLDAHLGLTDATYRFQAEYIRQRIEEARGNMTEAAEALGLHRSNLYRKMKQLDMQPVEDGS